MAFRFFTTLFIRNKLVIAMALALILFSTSLSVINSTVTRLAQQNRLEQFELPSVMNTVRLNIEKELKAAITASRQIADNEYVIDWLASGESHNGYVTSAEGMIKNHAVTGLVENAQLTSLSGLTDLAGRFTSHIAFTLREAHRNGEDYFIASDYIEERGELVCRFNA